MFLIDSEKQPIGISGMQPTHGCCYSTLQSLCATQPCCCAHAPLLASAVRVTVIQPHHAIDIALSVRNTERSECDIKNMFMAP